MVKNFFSFGLVLLFSALVLSGCTQTTNQTGQQDSGQTIDQSGQQGNGNTAPAAPKTVTIEFTDNGYVPSATSINAGDTVKWVNNGNTETWPASAMHPTHTVYPGSDIQKCADPAEKG